MLLCMLLFRPTRTAASEMDIVDMFLLNSDILSRARLLVSSTADSGVQTRQCVVNLFLQAE